MNNFIKGFSYAFSGFSWVLRPKIRRFVYIPLLINVALFIFAIIILVGYAQGFVTTLIGEKSDWWFIFRWAYDFVTPILTFLFYTMLLFISYFLFSSVANLIAAPFNSLLSKAVERCIADREITYSEIPLAKEILITFKTEIIKLIRFVTFAMLIILLLLIPVINIIFPIVWFIFMAYALSLQYIDYPMANHGHFLAKQRQVLKQQRMQCLGFGTAANLLLVIPGLNFIAIPVCVCGATIWWQKSLRHSQQLQYDKS